MSDEIYLNPNSIDDALADLRSAIEALETSFAKEIEGENKLKMVNSFNEIKQEYDELLTQYKALLIVNIDEAGEAIEALQETEKEVADGIKLLK